MSCKVKRKSQTPLNFRQFSFNYLKSIYSSSTWRRGRQEEGNDTCSHAESLLLPHMRYLLGGCSSRVQKAQSQLSTGLQTRLRHDRENRLTCTRVGWGELCPAAEIRWYCSRCTMSSPDLDAPVPLNVPWTNFIVHSLGVKESLDMWEWTNREVNDVKAFYWYTQMQMIADIVWPVHGGPKLTFSKM